MMLRNIADWQISYINWWADRPMLWLVAAILGVALWVGGTWVQCRFRRRR